MATQFDIRILQNDHTKVLHVKHPDESFEVSGQDGLHISILNNGDNTWQLVSGEADQETINIIGQAIEDHFNDQKQL